MTLKKAVIFISVLGFFSLAVPFFVIFKSISLNSGWNGILWDSTEPQVQAWVKKNNNRANWSKCPLSHFGVSCYKVTWKETEKSPYEYIEFQFQDGKLKAVIETFHQKDFQKTDLQEFGRASYGSDLAIDFYRDKGIKYKLADRVFYYENPIHSSKKYRIAQEFLVQTPINSNEITETILFSRITKAWYCPDYYEKAKNSNENFPSSRFLK